MKLKELIKGYSYKIKSVDAKGNPWEGNAVFLESLGETAEFICDDGEAGTFSENEILSFDEREFEVFPKDIRREIQEAAFTLFRNPVAVARLIEAAEEEELIRLDNGKITWYNSGEEIN